MIVREKLINKNRAGNIKFIVRIELINLASLQTVSYLLT